MSDEAAALPEGRLGRSTASPPVVAIFVGATILGFVVFPLIEPNAQGVGLMGCDLQRGRRRSDSRPARGP